MEILQILDNLNWQGITAIFLVNWFFTKGIKDQIIKLDEDLRSQGKRTDQLYQVILEILKENKK